MMEAQEDDDEIFVYMGGNQVVPEHVRRARIHRSVKIIRARAFQNRVNLVSVEFHDGIEIIEDFAFNWCNSLTGSIKLLGVRTVKERAFEFCTAVTDVEFGDKLATIEVAAFHKCQSLESITMPQVRNVGKWAFTRCKQLTDLDLPEGIETLTEYAFLACTRLRRITMPLKNDMIEDGVFGLCTNLTTVDLVGGVHKTVTSLHMESWRNEMTDEINRINQVLPNTHAPSKTDAIQQWETSVTHRLDYYKAEHKILLKEATTLLELALWKANLDNNDGGLLEREGVRTTRGQRKRARKEICVTLQARVL